MLLTCHVTRFILSSMIQSFACKDTAKLYSGKGVARFQAFGRNARVKLRALNQAIVLEDMMFPPGNRLEKLVGNRVGQYSIRINQQYRICFIWGEEGPSHVEIVDYH
jgi:toxin HigB-1